MLVAAKEEEAMALSTSSDACAVFHLAAEPDELIARYGTTPQLSENSHQGFARKNLSSSQGGAWTNSAQALGIEPVLLVEGVRSRCTGKERDAESGLDDFAARFYTSNYGRFLSPDESKYSKPADPQTWNLYGYVANNPLNAVDPTGHMLNPIPMQHSGGGATAASGETADLEETGSGSMGSGGSSDDSSDEDQKKNQQAQKKPAAQQQAPVLLVADTDEEADLANVIYNETSRLQVDPKAKAGETGSADDLHDGRLAIGEIANRVLASDHPERINVTSDLSPKEQKDMANGNVNAINAHNDSLVAAKEVLAGSNTTNGATQYRTRFGANISTPIGNTKGHTGSPVTMSFGPFPAGGRRREVIVVAQ
jgi:RHS repeat-associated protein